MATQVTRVQTDTSGRYQVEIVLNRMPEFMYIDAPNVEDLPQDVRDALLAWLTGETID